MGALPFYTESAENFRETETIGSFAAANKPNSFDDTFTEACDNLKEPGIRSLAQILDSYQQRHWEMIPSYLLLSMTCLVDSWKIVKTLEQTSKRMPVIP